MLACEATWASGKWLDDTTPKRGWTCVQAEDLGTDNLETCEKEQVRYIHHMIHGNPLPLNLKTGCICSGYMEGRFDDQNRIAEAVAAAKRRTANLVNRDARCQKFPMLEGWKVSKNGNPYIKKDKHLVTITKGQCNQQAPVNYSAIIDGNKLNKWLPTLDAAKLAAFDYLHPAIQRVNNQ